MFVDYVFLFLDLFEVEWSVGGGLFVVVLVVVFVSCC